MEWIEVFKTTKDVNYNIEMIAICIVVLVALFVVCVFLSHKLQIYRPSLRVGESDKREKRNK